MSLVTYPCADCDLNLQDAGTGAWACASETGSECGDYLEAKAVAEHMDEAVATFGHKHYSNDTRGEIARGMATGFGLALEALSASLDEDQFLRMCGVRG